ncbi:MAG: dienelactone hydrolase family protein [Acetobacter sp.]|jgi:phospholipase/carboxylesterase|nr:dienelactone hydrolase family protein [Acetobacter sp.]MCH4061095.1 dienelactone hydrolase family protein [Acetobacter sp.]MCH4088034.1 dienelactone hydrolase family protein [Acetobacter sp.]MCI1293352.1 dienelactone hydrolase family protein [Acetobacter sp.]MCI1320023.1 dienelactone hydrolase family protein [Acetobacter sp.]
MSDGLIIFLHGVGSQGASFSLLLTQWAVDLPTITLAAPDAPFMFDLAPAGRQWFSIKGVTEANRAERIVAARQAFDDTLQSCITKAGFGNRLDRVVLVGFSQGSIMALDAVVSGRWPVAGVVAFSGRLASPPLYAPSTETRILLIHGDADTIMPVQEAQKAEQILTTIGMTVTCDILPGVGHALTNSGVKRAQEFIQSLLFPGSIS